MSTRRAKQLIYGALYAVIWIVVIACIYFIFRWLAPGTAGMPPCGENCVPTSTQPIAVQGNILTFVTSPGHYTFLAQVANVNEDVGAESFDYDLNLYADASDTLLEAIPGQSFIYPNQVKYLVFPNEVVTGNIDHLGLTIGSPVWAASGTMGNAPQFTFGNLVPTTAPDTVSISGEITNSGIAPYEDLVIVALFKGPTGDPAGVSETEISSIDPGGSTDFSVIYPAAPGINPQNNQLFAYAIRSR